MLLTHWSWNKRRLLMAHALRTLTHNLSAAVAAVAALLLYYNSISIFFLLDLSMRFSTSFESTYDKEVVVASLAAAAIIACRFIISPMHHVLMVLAEYLDSQRWRTCCLCCLQSPLRRLRRRLMGEMNQKVEKKTIIIDAVVSNRWAMTKAMHDRCANIHRVPHTHTIHLLSIDAGCPINVLLWMHISWLQNLRNKIKKKNYQQKY